MRRNAASRLWTLLAAGLAIVLLLPATAGAHAEREASFPDGNGEIPQLLTEGPQLLVCKKSSVKLFDTLPVALQERNQELYAQCMESGFRHIQEAVDAVTEQNTRILVLPGVYREQPSLRAAAAGCDGEPGGGNGEDPGTQAILTYDQQRACPHIQNLIGIFGDGDGDRECDLPQCGLQIEGTGQRATDVILDGGFRSLNGIRADRVDGVRFTNFALQRFEFNALYILETDGFVIDKMVGRWNDEYAFLTFAVDHGLYQDCEGYGNGDSAIYPGSASDIHADLGLEDAPRYAVEIRNCRGHHNALGYSGTAGNAVRVSDSQFDHNQTGLATDSLFPNHPGLPQDHALFENNAIFSNNRDYVEYVHDGTCDAPLLERGYEHGVVCPVIPVPIGTGFFLAGGNYNRFEGNSFYDNWRSGTYQIYVPAALREEPENEGDTSHFNRYRENRLGYGPDGTYQPNGIDFWWDDQGEGNCWQDNEAMSGEVTHNAADPRGLPDCDSGGSPNFPLNPIKLGQIASCAAYDRRGSDEEQDPPGCDFFVPPERPEGREPDQAEIDRTGGKGAITTAARLAHDVFPDGADAAVLVAGDRPAQAVVAAPLAGKVGGPLLLTSAGGLSPATAAALDRLGTSRVYVVGTAGDALRGDLEAAGVDQVTVVAGGNRYRTAARVARMMGGLEVYITRGKGTTRNASMADAFAIAGLAASQQRPILLSKSTQLPEATASALADLGIVNAMLVGSDEKLTAGVEEAVAEDVPVVDRLEGADRYVLSAAAAELAITGIADESRAWVSNGRTSLDTLVAATAVAELGGVAIMVDKAGLKASGPTAEWLTDRRLDLANVHLVGGPARLSNGVADDIAAATGPQEE